MKRELISRAKKANSPEELMVLVKENGMELSEESAKAYFEKLNRKTGELADSELDNVSGGGCGGGDNADSICMAEGWCTTDYVCDRCGAHGVVYRDGDVYCAGCQAKHARCRNCMNGIGDKNSEVMKCKAHMN